MKLGLIPVGALIRQGYFYTATMYYFTGGDLSPRWAMSRN